MKRFNPKYCFLTCLATILLMTLNACTHNNGDIGVWFGSWHVEKIANVATGEPVEGYDGRYFMQFQSSVIRIVATDSLHNYEQSFGMWDDSDEGLLHVYFPDAQQFHCNLPGIEGDNVFLIEEKSDSKIVLSHAKRSDSTALRYWLVKQY